MRFIFCCFVLVVASLLGACSVFQSKHPDEPIFFSHSAARDIPLSAGSSNWAPSQWYFSESRAEERPVGSGSTLVVEEIAKEFTVIFATDSDQLAQTELQKLSQFFLQLKNPQASRFAVTGHTDNQHTAAYNQGLSDRRARTVARWLQHQGVASEHIRVEAHGLNKPVETNETVAGRSQNRRVEVRVLSDAKAW